MFLQKKPWHFTQNWSVYYHQTMFILSQILQTNYLRPYNSSRVDWKIPALVRPRNSVESVVQKTYHDWEFFETLLQFCGHQCKPYFKLHGNLKSFFFFQTNSQYYTLNVSKFYARWVTTYKLLLNLFYFEITMMVFSTKVFRTEAAAFNWTLTKWDYTLFKKVSPYFFLKDIQHGHTSLNLLTILTDYTPSTTLLTDFHYHETNSQFLKRLGNYVIGVIPWNFNPWVVNYPLIGGTGSLVLEYFYLTLISFFKQYTELLRYQELISLWKFL